MDASFAASILLLLLLGAFILRRNPGSALHRDFALGCVALSLWLGTLYWFDQQGEAPLLTLLGRVNFACIAWATLFGYLFIRELTHRPSQFARLLTAETLSLTLLTVTTPLIDRAELISGQEHVTVPGVLFPLFAVHVVAYPAASLWQAFSHHFRSPERVRSQLSVIGLGVAVTAAVTIVTGIVLPYGYRIYRYEEVGALSVVFLIAAIAYAITFQHLFNVQIVIKKTLVFAILVGLVEKVYSGGIELLVRYIPGADNSPVLHEVVSLATVLLISVSFHPVKRWLERVIDGMIYGRAVAGHRRMERETSERRPFTARSS